MKSVLTEEVLHDVDISCDITGLNKYQILGLLKTYTHSEIRKGSIKRGKFKPLDFIKMLDQKRQNGKRNLLK